MGGKVVLDNFVQREWSSYKNGVLLLRLLWDYNYM